MNGIVDSNLQYEISTKLLNYSAVSSVCHLVILLAEICLLTHILSPLNRYLNYDIDIEYQKQMIAA
jgi:hypothetical protein